MNLWALIYNCTTGQNILTSSSSTPLHCRLCCGATAAQLRPSGLQSRAAAKLRCACPLISSPPPQFVSRSKWLRPEFCTVHVSQQPQRRKRSLATRQHSRQLAFDIAATLQSAVPVCSSATSFRPSEYSSPYLQIVTQGRCHAADLRHPFTKFASQKSSEGKALQHCRDTKMHWTWIYCGA